MLFQTALWRLSLLAGTASSLGFQQRRAPDSGLEGLASIKTSQFWARDDPDEGDVVTDVSCELPVSASDIANSTKFRRDAPAVLYTRASEPQPLPKPDSDSADDMLKFIQDIESSVGDTDDNAIQFTPTDDQLRTWKIDWQGRQTPIGLTGLYYEFGNTPQNYKFRGQLTGCTAMIVASKKGFWAVHLWEGSKTVNGGSSFTKRISNSEVRERTDPEFKKLAVDPLTAATPSRQKAYRTLFKSLPDLKADNGDPFATGGDVDIFILTKASDHSNTAQMYPNKVAALKDAVNGAIPGSNAIDPRTYIGALDDPTAPDDVQGLLTFQYSPYDHNKADDDCTPMAAFRVWTEADSQPGIDKSWEALEGQQQGGGDAGSRKRAERPVQHEYDFCLQHDYDVCRYAHWDLQQQVQLQ
ncbi:Uu.00g051970.m01.CDS01 [Anthostomella pinea]|uniref:Uu.00g051970.m01.CDS01 n=1 Tax=Anthostomella pinea TaxID=933095 RepID=A0AAI8YM00_9PEZI|nr:Uu.00g051970.m01.CDS01 [Anthostomella pinea]